MVMLILTVKNDITAVTRGRLSLDLDPAADRLIVLDRASADIFYLGKIGLNKQLNLLLPSDFANNQNICVIMMDDNNVYNAAAADRVQLELVQTTLTG
jgi:hypothetical protein